MRFSFSPNNFYKIQFNKLSLTDKCQTYHLAGPDRWDISGQIKVEKHPQEMG